MASIFDKPDTTRYVYVVCEENLDPKNEIGLGVHTPIAIFDNEETLREYMHKSNSYDGVEEYDLLERDTFPFSSISSSHGILITQYYNKAKTDIRARYYVARVQANYHYGKPFVIVNGER